MLGHGIIYAKERFITYQWTIKFPILCGIVYLALSHKYTEEQSIKST